MLEDRSDEEIIALYKNGEEKVFKILIDRYTSPLFSFAVYLTDKNNAPDIIQESFIRVWKNLKRFDSSKASFKTWIFTITKNIAIDFLRKSGSTSGGKKSLLFSDFEKEEENSFSESIPDSNLLPDEALQKLQDKELLNNLLEKLSINYKTVLILYYQEEMTFEEIGKILNKSLNTVKSQHRRAIIELRKLLNNR